MTGKRFNYKFGKHMVLEYNFYDNSKKLTPNDVVALLNALHKENEQLKKRISDYADITAITTHILNEEKEIAEEGIALSVNRFNDLVNENERLKNENAKMKKELSLLAEFNQKAIL